MSSTQHFYKGMNQDVDERFQPVGTYRYLQNGQLLAENNISSITNDLGNQFCLELPNSQKIIGHVLTNTDDIIIFSTNDVQNHEIGLFNPNTCTYTSLINAPCLQFSTEYPVFALFRIRKGCERVIYFTDRNNNYRTINLDSLSVYRFPEAQDFDCRLFELNRTFQVPKFDSLQVTDFGGNLDLGSVQFAIRYLDEDLNPTNWMLVSNHVNIYDDPTTSNYQVINGGINIPETGDLITGAVPQTNKSIIVSLSELDTTFEYYQLAALHGLEATGTVSEVWLITQQLLTSDQDTFVYTGPNPANGDTQITLNEVAVDLSPIEVVHDHVQKDNVLWLANLRSSPRDWSDYQRAASLITTRFITQQSEINSAAGEFDSKNPSMPFDDRSLPGDEVVALGIQYLHESGQWSPAFHIPGRAPVGLDIVNLFVVESTTPATNQINVRDVAHFGLEVGDTIPRWRAFNTSDNRDTDGKGLLGYHQALNTEYQDIRDCNGISIWGVDAAGNQLAGTPIRHHRLPNRRTIPVKEGTNLNSIGLEFDNITYPSTDIVGHRFLMGNRDEFTSTVVDQGLLFFDFDWFTTNIFTDQGFFTVDNLESSEITTTPPFNFEEGMGSVFISPKTLVTPSFKDVDYFFINGIHLRDSFEFESQRDVINVEGGGGSNDYEVFQHTWNLENSDLVIINDVFNRNINGNIIVSPRSEQQPIQTIDYNIINQSYTNTINVYNLTDPLSLTQNLNGILDVTLKRIRDPYTNLDSIIYRPLHTNYKILSEPQETFGGDVAMYKFDYFDLSKIEIDGEVIGIGDENDINVEHFYGTFHDSTINYSLRHGGIDDCDAIFRHNEEPFQYIRRKAFTPDDNGTTYTIREEVCPETYLYNFDYSITNLSKPVFPLASTFDYCSNCTNVNPYRIRYSKQANQEEVIDNYQAFLANNYRDLDGSTGDINALVIDKDEMYALTNTPWFIPTRPQTLQTTESTIYIGTGDRLSLPPRKMITSYHQYGGTKFKESVVSTEFGTFYVDTDAGKVFKLAESIEEISAVGLREYTRNNIKLNLNETFRSMGFEYPIQTTTHEFGIGVRCTYDPIHRNYIIHKKDYDIIDKDNFEIISNLETVPTKALFYSMEDRQFYRNVNTTTPTDLSDTDYFENKSITLSYNIPLKAWNSFHSYHPSYLFNNEDTFYTSNNTRSIWEHNINNYQTYYGTTYPFILDIIAIRSNNNDPAPIDSDKFIATNFVLDITSNDVLLPNEFFEQCVFYNTTQSSGLLNIDVKTNPFTTYSTTTAIAERVDNEWNLSHIRDLVVSRIVPIFSDSWLDIRDQYPIDKVPNPLSTSPTKSLFEIERFRDHYLGQRYYYNSGENRLNFQFLTTNSKNSIR